MGNKAAVAVGNASNIWIERKHYPMDDTINKKNQNCFFSFFSHFFMIFPTLLIGSDIFPFLDTLSDSEKLLLPFHVEPLNVV